VGHAASGTDTGIFPAEWSPGSNGDGPSAEVAKRLERLPPEIGTLLMIVGIAGLLLPGPVGSPFFIAGGVALWPSAFGCVDGWFRRRFPVAHRSGMEQIERYLADLEKRYPGILGEAARPGREARQGL
jgi:hypothetical protein